MDHGRKISLAGRLILFIILCNSFVTISLSLILLYRDYQAHLGGLENQLLDIEKSTKNPLAKNLWDENESMVRNLLEGIGKLPYMQNVRIYTDDKKNPAFEVGKWKEEDILQKRVPLTLVNGERVDQVGELVMAISLEGPRKTMRKQILGVLGIQLAQALVISFLFFFIFKKMVARHLGKMAAYCGEVARNLDKDQSRFEELVLDRSKRVDQDELDQVVEAFNKMRSNLMVSHERLRDYSKNLEIKVAERTQEIVEEKKKLSNILNGMKEGIFSISSHKKIEGPVSASTRTLFGEDLEGKALFDTLFKDLNRDSEEFAQFKSALEIIFDEDDLQYDLCQDHLVSRIQYEYPHETDANGLKIKNPLKVFSVSYSPMWNEQKKLEKLLLVVSDITDFEELTRKMEIEKNNADKNIQVIKEISLANTEDFATYLNNSCELLANTIFRTKELGENPQALTEIFRYLHTLKGNSRALGLGLISQATHEAENLVAHGLEVLKVEPSLDAEFISLMQKRVYAINGEIQFYSQLARRIFRIDNLFELKILQHLHGLLVDLDMQLILIFGINDRFLLLENEEKENIFKIISTEYLGKKANGKKLVELQRITHSLAGVMRFLNQDELIEATMVLESTLARLSDGTTVSLQDFQHLLMEKMDVIKQKGAQIYRSSSLYREFPLKQQEWIPLFRSIFYLGRLYEKAARGEGLRSLELKENHHLIYDLASFASTMHNHFFQKVIEDLSPMINDKSAPVEEQWDFFEKSLSQFQRYLGLVSKISGNSSKVSRESFLDFLENLPEDLGETKAILEKYGDHSSLLFTLMEVMVQDGVHPWEYFRIVYRTYLRDWKGEFGKAERTKAFSMLSFRGPRCEMIGEFQGSLGRAKTTNRLPDSIRLAERQGDPIAKSLVDIFYSSSGEADFYPYLTFLDLGLMLTAHLHQEGGQFSEEWKVQTLPMVATNYNRLREAIESLPPEDKSHFPKLLRAFKHILDVPIMPSFLKYRPMVNEISERLGKKVDFIVGGQEVTMSPNQFQQVQDAVVHILRNSLDHGLENVEERKSRKKSRMGRLELDCLEENNSIIIKVRDDGRGIDLEKIKAKAVTLGIATPEEARNMTQEEIIKLIFVPKLSTKEEISELSGRGMGMDIVKNKIEKIGGHVEVHTSETLGTEIILSIPA